MNRRVSSPQLINNEDPASLQTPVPSSTPEDELPDGYVGCGTILATGVTYRQLLYWSDRGFIRAASFGSGYRRLWPVAEARIGAAMGRLIVAGLSVNAAAALARRWVRSPDEMRVRTALAQGVVLELTTDLWSIGEQE